MENVTEMGARKFGHTYVRVCWLTLVSPMACTIVGCVCGGLYIAGAAFFHGGVSAGDVIRGVPVAVLSSSIVTGPFSVVGGIGGALLATALGRGVLRDASKARWIRVATAVGAVPGLLIALFFMMRGADAVFSVVTILACSASGAIVGWLAWREFGSAAAD